MAVRFDAAADRLLRTTDLLDYNAAYTKMAWIYLTSDLDAISVFFTQNDNSANNLDQLMTSPTGTLLQIRVVVGGAATNTNGSTVSTGTWYHVALVRESVTSLKLYFDAVLDSTNTRDVTGRAASSRMEHGARSSGNNNRYDGRVYAIKYWSAALTLAEIANERPYIWPRRFANLYECWPCLAGATERLRGYVKGRNWTESGTLTDEAPPSVAWGIAPQFPQLTPAAAAAGNPWYAYAQM